MPSHDPHDRGRCPHCGAALAEGAGPGPCPACLMKLGISGAIPRLEDAPQGEAELDDVPGPQAEAPAAAEPAGPAGPAATHDVVPGRRSAGGSWRPLLAMGRVTRVLVLGVVGAAVVLFAVAAIGLQVTEPPDAPEYRLSIDTPATGDPLSLAVSPDGRSVVFVGSDGRRSSLWIRPMASTVATPMAGTGGAVLPFWSPDSRHVAFFADGALRRIGIGGDPPQTVAEAPDPCGGVWQPAGTILFVPDCAGGIARVSAAGGAPDVEWLTGLDEGESGHRFPTALPDPELVLFLADGREGARFIDMLSLDSGERRRLLAADSAAWYSPTGHLLYVRAGRLLAVPFDVGRRETTGEPFLVAEGVASDAALGAAALSVSQAGAIVFRTGPSQAGGRLLWTDRDGRTAPLEGDGLDESGDIGDPALSPDGTRLAFRRTVNGNADVWILELRRGTVTRFTFDAAADDRPLWSPDGQRILFRSRRGDGTGLYVKQADGAGSPDPLFVGPGDLDPTDWSMDGRLVLSNSRVGGRRGAEGRGPGGWGISVLDIESGESMPVIDTAFDDRDGHLSPDGRWVAYESDQSGRREIFLQAFPQAAGVRQVSTGGGTQPRWSPDGRELFYLGEDRTLMAVSLEVTRDLPDFGRQNVLFGTDTLDAAIGSAGREASYAVTPDSRFVFVAREQAEPNGLTVLLNWRARPR